MLRMTTHGEYEVERRALGIPPEARLRLAAKLLSSVPGTVRTRLSEEHALDLAEKRADELDSGKVAGLDYREEIGRIRSSLSRR
jgi:hypothetical protein